MDMMSLTFKMNFFIDHPDHIPWIFFNNQTLKAASNLDHEFISGSVKHV